MTAALWPGEGYPYIDLLDDYDGDTPSQDEMNQMNVYVFPNDATLAPSHLPALSLSGKLALAAVLIGSVVLHRRQVP